MLGDSPLRLLKPLAAMGWGDAASPPDRERNPVNEGGDIAGAAPGAAVADDAEASPKLLKPPRFICGPAGEVKLGGAGLHDAPLVAGPEKELCLLRPPPLTGTIFLAGGCPLGPRPG